MSREAVNAMSSGQLLSAGAAAIDPRGPAMGASFAAERVSPQALVDEIKVRARVRLSRARREGAAGSATLRDHLHQAAREVGFAGWEQARLVLGALAAPGGDMGSFWHVPRSGILLHIWFSEYAQARSVLAQQADGFLLPYRRQCFIVQAPFIEALGLNPVDPAWAVIGRDLVAGYGTPAWRALAWQRLNAPAGDF
ncbi:hypothetical protein CTTA_1025 [Comamonas testosteroni]|uniref:Uncharacterized protein n=1 Tax=Comamonas testosteroni TaxID=285 RepID=A0A5A7M8U3_COMTE|nr:hypothetical protein [Comamonas testosteroni]GEQ74020.1 hypothetical protein CTTA_1025 [Comamonas testosteroni]